MNKPLVPWKTIFIGSLICLMSMARPVSAFDFFELRVGVGLVSVNPNDLNRDIQALSSSFDVNDMSGMHIEALFNPPILPLGVGLRLEQYGDGDETRAGSNDLDYDVNYTRYSAVANWRLLDNVVYLGPIATLGLHRGSVTTAIDGIETESDLSAHGPSGTLGAEVGVKIRKFMFGVEGGYQYLELAKGDRVLNDVDLSGAYIRLHAGIRF